ncbi:MAG: GtrA family protein [Pseudodonghicola sp.]
MTTGGLILRYGAFAAVATLSNLGTQRLAFALAPEAVRLLAALVCGTGIGLVVKYLLDKRWIFFATGPQPLRAETGTFLLYTLTGAGTTLLFWATEAGFWALWETQAMREAGALLGLAAGYVIKYHLDKRFVFRSGG